MTANIKQRTPRQNDFFDKWSIVHITSSFALTLLVGPGWAFAIVVLWEPIELFVISPLAAKLNILFGHETIRNSLSDILFDAVGVALGILLIAR